MDLHLHTPASADWLEPGVSYLQWLQKAESRGLDIVAITDHNTVEGVARLRAEIERLTWLEENDRLRPQERRDLDEYRRLGDKILVLPGFEFTATFGFHVLAIFPPETPLRVLELLLLQLNVPVERLAEGSTEVGATADVLTAYRLIDEAGGLVIAAHANSTHGVAMRGINFGGQTKIAYTQDLHLHALEVTDLDAAGRRSTARFFDGSKPEYPRRMHCIQGSDAHRLMRDPKDKNRLGIGDRVTEILLPEVSFEALMAALKGDDFSVTRPYRPLAEEPYDFVLAAREAGNTIVQSFHESLVLEGGRNNRILADIVAFANTQGGTIFVGASASKKGAPRGVDHPQETIARLKREIEQDIAPPLACRIDTLQSQGATIVRVIVPAGTDKPYTLRQTRIYVRQEGETSEAVRDELIRLILEAREAPTVKAAAAQPTGVTPTTEADRPAGAGRAAETIGPAVDAVFPAAAPGDVQADAAQPTAAEPAATKPSRRRRRRSTSATAAEPQPTEPTPTEAAVQPLAPEPAGAEAQPAEITVAEPFAQPVLPESTTSAESAPTSEPAPLMSLTPEGEPAIAELAGEPPALSESADARQAAQPEAISEAPSGDASAEPAPTPKRRPRRRSARPAEAEQPTAASEGAADVASTDAAPITSSAEPAEAEAADAHAAEEAMPETIIEAAEPPNILEAPAVGVEILATEERQDVLYFTIRDLRNCNTVRNVTAKSARKLWSYAINQYLKRPIDPAKITWSGDYGLWQIGRRAKKLRYDLVRRQPDGSLRVYYGVTADGMDGPWAQFLQEEDRLE